MESPRCRRAGARLRTFSTGLAAVVLAVLAFAGPARAATAPWTGIASPGGNSAAISPVPDIAWDGTGLWAAWGSETLDVEVRRWNGASWTAYPQPVNETLRNKMPSITWDGTKPWVAWNDDSYAMQVAYWNGASWVQIASPGTATSNFSTPDLVWASGALHAAWQDAGRVVRVARWNGAAWVGIASPGSGSGNNAYPNLEWDGTNLFVAWSQPNTISISRLVGAAWSAHATLAVPGAPNPLPTIEFVGTRLYVAYETGGTTIGLAWWDGAQFRAIPSPGGGTVYMYPTLEWTGSRFWASYVVDPGAVTLAWYDPVAPNAPSSLAQYQSDGTTVINGGSWTRFGGATSIVAKGGMSDPQASEQLLPWYEVRPTSSALSTTCGQQTAGYTRVGTQVAAPTGGTTYTGSLDVSGLSDATPYWWRMCVVDGFGFPSGWTARGGNPDFQVDLTAPTAAHVTPAAAATGQLVNPTLWASYLDAPSGNNGTLDFQVCTVSDCSVVVRSGTVGATSGMDSGWTVASALATNTTYWWRARSTDTPGNVGSWTTATAFTTVTPNTPANPVHVSPAPGSSMVDTTPTLTATFADADGGTGTITFEVCTVPVAAGQTCTAAGGSVLASGTSAAVANGANATWTPGAALAVGTVHWHAQASDGGNTSGWSASWSLRVGTPTMTISADAPTVALGALVAGIDATSTSTFTVTTDSAGGYQLTARDGNDAWAATNGSGGTVADWTGTDATPSAWLAATPGGMGMTMLSETGPGTKDAKWGTGVTATDFTNNRYAGLEATSDVVVHSRTSYAAAADTVTVGWRVNLPAGQAGGTYGAATVWTAVALP